MLNMCNARMVQCFERKTETIFLLSKNYVHMEREKL
jgi:hypothetical protein